MTPRPAHPATRRPAHPALAVLLALATALGLGGCKGPGLSPWSSSPGPYDRLSPGQVERLAAARTLLDQRDALGAVRVYENALDRDSLHAGIARALQDARLAALTRGDSLPEVEAWRAANRPAAEDPPEELLWRWYDAVARERGDVLDRLMAARLDPDARAGLRQLDDLVADEPGCIWAHLGRANTLARLGRLDEAREALDVALELDPGHAPTRRLEALILEREGEGEAYVAALERWLERTERDPLVTAEERDWTTLNLAVALLDEERYGAARRRLDELIEAPRFDELNAWPRYNAFLLRAAAREGRGDYPGALEDAERARTEAPARLAPWIHIAVLNQYQLGDPEAAVRAWTRVTELAVDAPQDERVTAFFAGLRAYVERARVQAAMPAEDDAVAEAGP